MNISEKIKTRRHELGLTLRQVAEAVGVNQSTVKRWEDGDIQSLKMTKIPALSRVLLVDMSYLLGVTDNPAKIDRDSLLADCADLTETEIAQVREYITFIKSRRKNK